MTVAPTTAVQKLFAAPEAAAKPATSAGSDFDMYLKMLTAQLKNQDPMNPMEGSDFAVDLATFSGVEQQAHTNELLQSLLESVGGAGLSQYADWIGKSVRTTGAVHFGDVPLTLDLAPEARADKVILVTRDARGREVSREDVGRGTGEVDWFGRDMDGAKFPDGAYSFTLEQFQGSTRLADAKVGAYARVVEAKTGPSGALLVLEGGTEVAAGSVTALRNPA